MIAKMKVAGIPPSIPAPDPLLDRQVPRWNVRAASPSTSPVTPVPADFPNVLHTPEPLRPRLSSRGMWIWGLLLLCLLPRALMVLRLSSICPDGVMYIRLALALEEGHFQEAFQEMNLNLYPVVLMGLHRLGFDWFVGGALWGIVISSLTVLPLFGWIRRQFDDRTALLAGVLYAVHPVFIQWSPEIIRDPTFWFFFTLTLYLLWRAVTEVRWRWFLTAGLALTLAVLTRFEGFFLLTPLVLWTFWRWKALASRKARWHLVAGMLTVILAFPLLIVAVNLTWLHNYGSWVFSRMAPLMLVHYWWSGMVVPMPSPQGVPPEIQAGVPLLQMIRIFTPTMVKGLSPLFAVLLLAGVVKWWKVWLRRDHQTLFITALVMFAAAWIHAWCAHESCERYFLPIVLMGSPFAALAFIGLVRILQRGAERLQRGSLVGNAAWVAPLLVLGITGWVAAFGGSYARRAAEVELAQWIRDHCGSQATLFGSEGVTPVVGFYAQLPWTTLTKEMDDPTVLAHVARLEPDVILVLCTRRKDVRKTYQLVEQIKALGFCVVDRSRLPAGTDHALTVVVRKHANTHTACRPKVKSR